MVENRPVIGVTGHPAEARPGVLERRDSPRYPAGRVGFRCSQIQASLVDLSHDGLAIESLEHAPIGCTLIFALEQGRDRVDADAEVCWCKLKRTYRTAGGDVVPVYRAGLRLGDRRPALLDAITRSAKLEWVAGYA
jgi:hypothetical protein